MDGDEGAFHLKRTDSVTRDALYTLYDAVNWSGYTQDVERLERAISGSAFVVTAWIDEHLVGLARCVSDNASIVYIQDILVRPEHQRKGIGRALVQDCLEHFAHIRQKVLLTDDRPEQLRFYESLGFRNTRDLVKTPLNAFVIMTATELA